MLGEVKKPWKPNLGDTGQEGLDEEEGEGGDKTEEDGGSEEKVFSVVIVSCRRHTVWSFWSESVFQSLPPSLPSMPSLSPSLPSSPSLPPCLPFLPPSLSLPPSPPFLPQVPTWHFNGFDYPYYNVEMIDGSTCDIRGNNPRSVSVLYICQTDAPTFGMVCVYVHVCKCLCMFVPTHLSYYVLYNYIPTSSYCWWRKRAHVTTLLSLVRNNSARTKATSTSPCKNMNQKKRIITTNKKIMSILNNNF